MSGANSTEKLRALLHQVAAREIPPEAALQLLEHEPAPPPHPIPIESLRDASGQIFARLDHDRTARQGFPEVIFCAGKTPEQVAAIAQRLYEAGAPVLATRANLEHAAAVRAVLPEAQWHELAGILTLSPGASGWPAPRLPGVAGVVCAGTSDLPIAEEARLTLNVMGAQVETFYDCGVAGLHRLLDVLPQIRRCDVLICAAGMEGALPSVLAGLVSAPVVAVPTSVGYGASFGGVAALLAMLNACANGVAVVNIDNGFGAAAFAASILRVSTTETQKHVEEDGG